MTKRDLVKLALAILCIWLIIWGISAGFGADSALAEETGALASPGAAIDLTPIIDAAIALIGALVAYRLVPWLKANTTEKQQAILQTATATAVYAAEQLYKTGEIQNRLDYAMGWLKQHGYSVDRAQVEAEVARQRAALPLLIGEAEVKEEEANGNA